MYDICITIKASGHLNMVWMRELHQFHPVIIITAKEVALETWNTSEDWHESK